MAETHTRQPRRMTGRQLGPSLCSCGDPWPCKVATGEQCWTALKDYLSAQRQARHDLAVESGGTSYDEGVIHGLETALAKMAELEQS